MIMWEATEAWESPYFFRRSCGRRVASPLEFRWPMFCGKEPQESDAFVLRFSPAFSAFFDLYQRRNSVFRDRHPTLDSRHCQAPSRLCGTHGIPPQPADVHCPSLRLGNCKCNHIDNNSRPTHGKHHPFVQETRIRETSNLSRP